MGGFRDHRPLEATISARFRCQRLRQDSPVRWNRELLLHDLKLLQHSDEVPARVQDFRSRLCHELRVRAISGHWQQECGTHQRYTTTSSYYNSVEGAVVDAAYPLYVNSPKATPQKNLTDATLALVRHKQYFQRMLPNVIDHSSWLYKSILSQFRWAAKRAKQA
eukprot:5251388-Pyramimonas_sp.AAC.1